MVYGDVVIDCNGVKFFCDVVGFFNFVGNYLIKVFEVYVIRYELCK